MCRMETMFSEMVLIIKTTHALKLKSDNRKSACLSLENVINLTVLETFLRYKDHDGMCDYAFHSKNPAYHSLTNLVK